MNRSIKAAERRREAQKKKGIILGVLIGVLGLIWLKSLFTGRPDSAVGSTAVAPTVSMPANAPSQNNGQNRNQRPVVHVAWPVVSTRNPFLFDADSYEKKAALVTDNERRFDVQGTLLGDDPRALINGRMLRVGESIDDAVLKRIEHAHVILEVDGVEVTVGE